jgi:hypothetical protein
MASTKLAPKLHVVASPSTRTTELPNQEVAWKVYESLPESSIVEMLFSSERFLELCRWELQKLSPPTDLLLRFARKRSEWLREDPVYAATVFIQSWPENRPPRWVMDWTYKGFRDFLEEKSSLAASLGFTERAPKSARRREGLLMQFVEISRLRALKLSVRVAASLVCCRDNPALHAADNCESADKLEAMTNSLTAEYSRYPGRDELTELYKLMRAKATDEIVGLWLSNFPRNEVLRIPALRRFLP